MAVKYTDIPVADLETFRPYIKQQGEVTYNLTGDRCIVKWEGADPICLDKETCVCRNNAEAQAYYKNPINGWCTEPEL